MSKKEIPKKKKGQAIEIIDSPEIKRLYSNYLSVTTTSHECNLTFCHIDPANVTASKAEAKVVSKIMIPNSLVEEVLGAIEINYRNALKRMGAKKIKPSKSR